MATSSSGMDVDALDDAIYKLCTLRNSTAFQIANASMTELAPIDVERFTFNSIADIDLPNANLLKELRPKLDGALQACEASLDSSRSRLSTQRDVLIRCNGLASLPDNVLFRVFASMHCDDIDGSECVWFYQLSLTCHRLRAIILKVAKTWGTLNLEAETKSPHIILGLMKFAPNAKLHLRKNKCERGAPEQDPIVVAVKLQRVVTLITDRSFWPRISSLELRPDIWMTDCALLSMKRFEGCLPKELPELTAIVIAGLNEKELLFVDRLFRHDIDYPKLSEITVFDSLPSCLPRNITSLTLRLPGSPAQMISKLPDTLSKAPHLKEFTFTFNVFYKTECALDDVSTTVELPSLTLLSLKIRRKGCVDGIGRFMRLFRFPKLVKLDINCTIYCERVDRKVITYDKDDVQPTSENGRSLHLTFLGKNGPMHHLKTISITMKCSITKAEPGKRFDVVTAVKSQLSTATTEIYLLPTWVDIPFRDVPNVEEVNLDFKDRNMVIHFPRGLEMPAVRELSLRGIRGLQWGWLSKYLKGLKTAKKWNNFDGICVQKCEKIDKHVEKLRSLVADKRFTYEKPSTYGKEKELLFK